MSRWSRSLSRCGQCHDGHCARPQTICTVGPESENPTIASYPLLLLVTRLQASSPRMDLTYKNNKEKVRWEIASQNAVHSRILACLVTDSPYNRQLLRKYAYLSAYEIFATFPLGLLESSLVLDETAILAAFDDFGSSEETAKWAEAIGIFHSPTHGLHLLFKDLRVDDVSNAVEAAYVRTPHKEP